MIGSSFKGILLLCGTIILIALAWLTLAYLEERDKHHAQRTLSALSFAEKAIEAKMKSESDIYDPSMTPGQKADRWVLTGILVYKDSVVGTIHKRFVAILKSLCPVLGNPDCWQMDRLSIDGEDIGNLEEHGKLLPATAP